MSYFQSSYHLVPLKYKLDSWRKVVKNDQWVYFDRFQVVFNLFEFCSLCFFFLENTVFIVSKCSQLILKKVNFKKFGLKMTKADNPHNNNLEWSLSHKPPDSEATSIQESLKVLHSIFLSVLRIITWYWHKIPSIIKVDLKCS